MLFCITTTLVIAQVQSTTFAAHEQPTPTPSELYALDDVRLNIQDQFDAHFVWGSLPTTNFYTNITIGWTNTATNKGFVRIPITNTLTAGIIQVRLDITNSIPTSLSTSNTMVYTSNTTTCVLDLPTGGVGELFGWVYANSSLTVSIPNGTAALLSTTNNFSSIDWQ